MNNDNFAALLTLLLLGRVVALMPGKIAVSIDRVHGTGEVTATALIGGKRYERVPARLLVPWTEEL